MIRGIFLNGTTFTVAGNGTASSVDGDGTEATFNSPTGITVSNKGDLFVTQNHAIRIVYRNRTVVTLAGSTIGGFANGQGRAARFSFPSDIAIPLNGVVILLTTLFAVSHHRVPFPFSLVPAVLGTLMVPRH